MSFEKGVALYWRIKSKDNKYAQRRYSLTFSFYTEGDGASNHLPLSPSVVLAALNSAIQEVTSTLEWTVGDIK